MANKITDLENQPQQQHTSLIKDLDQLQILSEEELQGVVGGGVDTLLTGLIFQGAEEVDNQIVDGVREFLFPG